MEDKQIFLLSSLLLGFAAILHFTRVISGWSMVIESWLVPRWLSILAFLLAGFLSYKTFIMYQKSR
jgi:urea transporter